MPRSLPRTLAAAALAVALLATSVPGRDGLVARGELRPVPGADEFGALGGVETWLYVRGDGSVQQRFQVWAKGLFDAEGTTLWMSFSGDSELEEVAELAAFDGSARWQATKDSARDDTDELPLGVERVVDLFDAPVEIRDFVEDPLLEGRVGRFRYRAINSGSGRAGVKTSKSKLKRPRRPLPVLEPDARGFVRLYRKRVNDGFGPEIEQGIVVYAQGLTADADYEIWMEDVAGDLHMVTDEVITTAEGQALYTISTAEDTLPPELGVEDVRELHGARVEFRRAGDALYTLVGLMPRVR